MRTRANAEEPVELVRFTWSIPPDAQIVTLRRQRLFHPAASKAERVVIPTGERSWEAYDPIGPESVQHALFAILAETEPTPAGIVSFVERFGFLGLFETYAPAAKPGRMVTGEPVAVWERSITEIGQVLTIWEAVERGDETFLRNCFIWRGNRRVDYRSPFVVYPSGSNEPFGRILASESVGRGVFFDRWRRGEVLGPARLFVAERINATLQGNVTPQLLFDETGTFRPYTRPVTLLGAIWCQFYETFAGVRKVRRCPECLQWMTCGRQSKRMHPACASRRRQREFKARHQQK